MLRGYFYLTYRAAITSEPEQLALSPHFLLAYMPGYAHVLAILLTPPPTRRYPTGVVIEGLSGELQFHVQSGVGVRQAEGVPGEQRYNGQRGVGIEQA